MIEGVEDVTHKIGIARLLDDSISYSSNDLLNEAEFADDDIGIEEFLHVFHEKIGVRVMSLKEAVSIIDVLSNGDPDGIKENNIEKLRNKAQKEREKNNDMLKKMNVMQEQIFNLQKENDQYKSEQIRVNIQIDELECQLRQALKEKEQVKDTLERANNTKNGIEKSVSELHEIIQSQIDDSKMLSDQRNSLFQLYHSHVELCREYEEKINDIKCNTVSNVIETDQNYHSILALISRSVCMYFSGEKLFEINKIMDDGSISPIERSNKVFSFISQKISCLESRINDMENEIRSEKEKFLEFSQKHALLINFLEEEQKFLNILSSSQDIQECILYRPEKNCSLVLDPVSRNFILKHSVAVAQFIEEAVLDLEKISINLSLDGIDSSKIFSILSPNTFKHKVERFMNHVSDSNSDSTRELMLLFAAQVFANEILQNHCVELKSRLDLKHTDSLNLTEDRCDCFDNPELYVCNKSDEKIRERISKVIPDINNRSTSSLVKELLSRLKTFSDENKSIHQENQLLSENNIKMTEENQNIRRLYRDKKHEIKKRIKRIEAESLQKQSQQDRMGLTINELNEKIQSLSNEVEFLKNSNGKYEAELNEIKSANDKEISEKIGQLTSELESYKNRLSRLQVKLRSSITKKKELKVRVNTLEDINTKAVNTLKQKSIALKDQYEESINDLQSQVTSYKSQNSVLMDQNRVLSIQVEDISSQLSGITLSHKTLELKLKSSCDKLDTQIQTQKAQYESRINSIKLQNEDKIRNIKENYEYQIHSMISKINTQHSLNLHHWPLELFLDDLNKCFIERKRAQDVYEETVTDLLKVQSLLHLSPSSNIYEAVSNLQTQLDEYRHHIQAQQNSCIQLETAIESKQKDLTKAESQVWHLKQWESWARKLHRIIYEKSCSTLSIEQLRLSLEEALLATVSNRKYLYRLFSLREQKKAFVLFAPNISKRMSASPSWFSTIGVSIFCRRVLQISGHLTIQGIVPLTPSSFESSSIDSSKKSAVSSPKRSILPFI